MRESIARQGLFASTRYVVLAALVVGMLLMARLSLPAVSADEKAPELHVQTMCVVCHPGK